MSEDQCGRLEEGRDCVKIMGSCTKVRMFVNSIEQQHKYSGRTPSLNTHLDYIIFYFFIESAPDHWAETHRDVQQIASPCLFSLALAVGKFKSSLTLLCLEGCLAKTLFPVYIKKNLSEPCLCNNVKDSHLWWNCVFSFLSICLNLQEIQLFSWNLIDC